MISFTVRLTFENADHAYLVDVLERLTTASRQEAGCVSYIAHFLQSDPATVFIYEQYADEAAVEHHRNSPHFLQYARNGFYLLPHARTLEMLDTIG